MGGKVQSGNFAHDQACAIAEGVRQVSAAAAGSNQVAINAAEIVFARAVIASCVANLGGAGAEAYRTLLRGLGTGGV